MADTKLVKVYIEDWNTLNDYLSIRQLREGKRLTFPDILGQVIKENIKPVVDEVKKGLKG